MQLGVIWWKTENALQLSKGTHETGYFYLTTPKVHLFIVQKKRSLNLEDNILAGDESNYSGCNLLKKWKFIICIVLSVTLR
jgi:hypothetical protein